jgi:flavin reductase (DIM6/NTAB) family NADH-FMN oxidoreductase RutF
VRRLTPVMEAQAHLAAGTSPSISGHGHPGAARGRGARHDQQAAPSLEPVPPVTPGSGPGSRRAVDADLFRQALATHAAGVAIVTVCGDAGPAGLTVTSFSSASLDPPLVSFYIGHGSSNWPAVRVARHFAVNLVGVEHESLAARFARKGEDRFAAPTRWHLGTAGLPLLTDASTHLLCVTHSLVTVGDHELVIGEVIEATVRHGAAPLLYHRGRFARPS